MFLDWSFIRIAKEGGVEARVATELNLSIAARQEIHTAGLAMITWTHRVAMFLVNFIKSFFGRNLAKIL